MQLSRHDPSIQERLRRVLGASGVVPERVRVCEELAEGTFNTAYRVLLDDGTDLVLKIAPAPDTPMMGHEHGMMHTEELFYRLAHGRLPVPEVVHADHDRRVIESDFLLMTRLPGRTWYSLRAEIAPADRARLRSELGNLVAGLHRVTGSAFGHPQRGLSTDWRTAFLAMVDAVLADAHAYDASLPVPAGRVAELLRARAHLLDEVTTPVLVHFDLWAGNILLDTTERGPVIGGIVDGERAFWGDPLADMVSLALFGDVGDDPDLLRGYRSAGGVLDLDGPGRQRLAMYQCYLYLVMLVEAVPRGASGPEHERAARIVRDRFLASLDALGAA